MPESKSFYEGNLPWTQVGNKLDKVNISAQTKWESLQKKGKEEQKKWLKGWIKDKTETRSAPSEQGIS